MKTNSDVSSLGTNYNQGAFVIQIRCNRIRVLKLSWGPVNEIRGKKKRKKENLHVHKIFKITASIRGEKNTKCNIQKCNRQNYIDVQSSTTC